MLEQCRAIQRSADAGGWRAHAQSPANLALPSIRDNGFKRHLDRTKHLERVGATPDRRLHREQAVRVLLEPLEGRLRGGAQLDGEQACATDIGIFPFVRQLTAIENPGGLTGCP